MRNMLALLRFARDMQLTYVNAAEASPMRGNNGTPIGVRERRSHGNPDLEGWSAGHL